MTAILVCYGFSGSPRPLIGGFPNGTDQDSRWRLVAETLETSLKRVFPQDTVSVKQTWSQEALINAILASPVPLREVHIVSHGDGEGVFLAYHYGTRIHDRAMRYNALAGTANDRAKAAIREEDALIAGVFSGVFPLPPATITALKSKMMPNAHWQLWGCWCGDPFAFFEGDFRDPEVQEYMKRFNFGRVEPGGPGIAKDIAAGLGVTCTAGSGGALGLSGWHGVSRNEVRANTIRTRALKPMWLWNTMKSEWVSYGPTGARLPMPAMLGKARVKEELPTGAPPKWLTDLFWGP